jgi:hypothetical protein
MIESVAPLACAAGLRPLVCHPTGYAWHASKVSGRAAAWISWQLSSNCYGLLIGNGGALFTSVRTLAIIRGGNLLIQLS